MSALSAFQYVMRIRPSNSLRLIRISVIILKLTTWAHGDSSVFVKYILKVVAAD